MRKSEIETDFEAIRLLCVAEEDRTCEGQLCDHLNGPCAREFLADGHPVFTIESFPKSRRCFAPCILSAT